MVAKHDKRMNMKRDGLMCKIDGWLNGWLSMKNGCL
jgi:hypothetical protein